jgi:hypothetical protein
MSLLNCMSLLRVQGISSVVRTATGTTDLSVYHIESAIIHVFVCSGQFFKGLPEGKGRFVTKLKRGDVMPKMFRADRGLAGIATISSKLRRSLLVPSLIPF